jgi:thiol-disulfide isomerase/thioredoxin
MASTDVVIETREDLKKALKESPVEYTMIKFYADWCAPCKAINPLIHECVKIMPDNIFRFIEINVDESFDVYAFLKSKKMARGIPTILLYKKSDFTEDRYYIPHDGVTGARKEDIKSMFNLVK